MSFKQFLAEGGAATSTEHTVRATKQDIEAALKFVSKAIGIPEDQLASSLLGSTPHTLKGLKKDSGDLDVALEDGKHDRKKIVAALEKATGFTPKVVGGNTYSFAVPTHSGRKVQVDLMFSPSEQWAKWMYHSAIDSKHKGKVRNQLLIAVAINQMEKGKDLIVKDAEGNLLVKVRRSLKNDEGLVRIHKYAPLRKDGKGRTKTLVDATEKDILAVLDEVGDHTSTFTMEKDQNLNPDSVAAVLFGKGTKAADLMSTEQVVKKVLALKNAKDVVKTAAKALEPDELPAELKPLLK